MNFKLSVMENDQYKFEAFEPETNELKDEFTGTKEELNQFIEDVIVPKYMAPKDANNN